MFTATVEGNYIKLIDLKTGATKRRIQFSGKLVQGPVVSEKEFSITVRHSAQLQYVLIYNLPAGTLKRRIRV
jgi:hypothetical protein